jgi:energy-coupling factor transporter ATP-binding protein EcfA2
MAIVLGVDSYEPSIPRLRCAVHDARAVGAALKSEHGFEVTSLFDAEVQGPAVRALFERDLSLLGPNDRLIFYFAGHGIAVDDDDGPAGHLLLHDARRDDTGTFLPMRVLHDHLTRLPCRHVLVILDCCFAGSFRWSSSRNVIAPKTCRTYREQYDRFVDSPAWQVLTSAASDQVALDSLASDRGVGSDGHSPFAAALLRGLRGGGDLSRDGLVTASELGVYLREQVEVSIEGHGGRQTPQLFFLNRHARGEFVFKVPGRELDLPPAPPLTRGRNPYRGFESYDEVDADLFFGRHQVVKRLAARVEERQLTVVTGPTGCGKSSLVRAGLIPALRGRPDWSITRPHRPGSSPLATLGSIAREIDGSARPGVEPSRAWLEAVETRAADPARRRTLVVIDRFEELATISRAAAEQPSFLAALAEGLRLCPGLRLVVTIRSDVESQPLDGEPRFQDGALARWWTAGRFPVPPMTQKELREAIERPADRSVLFFEPDALVDRLVDEFARLPAPLPCLSFTLSQLYLSYWERPTDDRALRETDYKAKGGAGQELMERATTLVDQLVAEEPAYEVTLRNLFVRMSTTVAGESARRRLPLDELVYDEEAENRRIHDVLDRLHQAHLILRGAGNGHDPDAADVAYIEPAHDDLVRRWEVSVRWTAPESAA